MPNQGNSSVELLINALNNEKVLDTLAKTLQPLIQAAVDNAVDKLSNELKLRNKIIDQLKKDNDDLKMTNATKHMRPNGKGGEDKY